MCCSGFLKIMMFIFNGAIFVAGAAILGVGVWVKVDSGSLLGVLEEIEDVPDAFAQLVNVGYLLIGVGAVLLVIGFLGCCGAIRESRCMLMTFFCIVLIIFLAEVAGAVVLFVFQGLVKELVVDLETQVRKSIEKDYGNENSLTNIWNHTMDEFKCCGFMNYTDFDNSPYHNMHGKLFYPPTCCNATRDGDVVVVCPALTARDSRVPGCFLKLVELLEDNAVIVAAVALGIAFVEIAAMVVSLVLYCKIGDNKA
ncbi:tetraspanin 34a [Odontesthes bonariensis]|uniref:tetraspanin 34a n=1 Tax=Odontesthes bonariensis TaxID=219752 RepID=UPI003F58362C